MFKRECCSSGSESDGKREGGRGRGIRADGHASNVVSDVQNVAEPSFRYASTKYVSIFVAFALFFS